MKTVLIATAKDEGHNILEWVAHHRLAGFSDFILFQNDSTDGTDETLSVLDEMGIVTYHDNPAANGRHQMRAYKRASRLDLFRTADFAMVLDLDEFLNIRVGGGTLTHLFAALPEFDHLILNWRLFGSGQIPVMTDDLVTARFTDTTSAERYLTNFTGYKSLFKPSVYAIPGIHQPRNPQKPEDQIIRVNGSGLVEPEFALKNWRSKDPLMTRYACVHHYAVKDIETFLLKSVRGSAHQTHRSLREKYWWKRNFGGTQDYSLVESAPRLWAEMMHLDHMSGGRLMRLRKHAFDHHRNTLETLRSAPDYSALRAHCLAHTPRVE
ncbi:MAG: glycosyltransferase family 2 protein [Pseudomonadota bacterium]